MNHMFIDRNGKFSSKRFMGITSGLFGGVLTFMDGLGFYEVDSELVITIFSYSAALLGIGTFEKKGV